MLNTATDDPRATGMTLRAAYVDDTQTLVDEQLIDDLVCDCCQTNIALAKSGPIGVYRDRSVDEIRDIAMTRHLDGIWQPGDVVATDNWEIAGCPVNGPSIAADGSLVAVAWFSAADEPVVQLALSTDSGAQFSAPIEIIRTDTAGRVAAVLLDSGDVAVSWLDTTESGGILSVRRVSANGLLGPIHIVSDGTSSLSVPQMALNGDDLVFVWTESSNDVDRVVSARVSVDAL